MQKILIGNSQFKIVLVLLSITLSNSGCATKLVEQVRFEERQKKTILSQLESKKDRLKKDTEVFVNGSCRLPSRSDRPPQVCENESESEQLGMAACAIKYGCSGSLLAFKEGLTSFQSKWMTTEACSAFSRKLENQGYDINHSVYNLTVAAVDSACENEAEGFWGNVLKGTSCLTAYAMAVERGIAFANCVSVEANKCESATEEWKSAPLKKLRKCENLVESINEDEQELASLQVSLLQKKDSLTWKLFGD